MASLNKARHHEVWSTRPEAVRIAMYEIDERDRVRLLSELPQPTSGDPKPRLIVDERSIDLTYQARRPAAARGGRSSSKQGDEDDELLATVRFEGVHLHVFGCPNDEGLHGHPLFARGLESYGAFEVQHSSLIRHLERRNRVHDAHDAKHYQRLRHVVITFHDSTFECLCERFEIA
jgi:hypothetical protein